MKMLNENEKEIMLITQEECAEVTQAISKVFRFGFLIVDKNKFPRSQQLNRYPLKLEFSLCA